MRERLDVMVQQEMENKTMYLEERMNYLQTQINPHFMCNTLNVIGIMGSEHGAQDIQDACVQLSSLLRYSIADSDENKTTLQEEMQNIRDYLQLMRLRYEHKLVYRVDYDEKMQHMSMPRLVLEPFVENIFAHAYGPQHKIVHVEVSAWQTQQRWYISIKDNGQGVEQEKLQQMRQHIRDGCRQILAGKRVEKRFGIGVENTIMRLCLFYGDSFQFDLISQPGEGLQITLSAEKEKENQYETDKRIDSGR
jgi:two-component system sensor histidine kinase YesM